MKFSIADLKKAAERTRQPASRWFLTILLVFYEIVFHLYIGKPFSLFGFWCMVGFAVCLGAVLDLAASFLKTELRKTFSSVFALFFAVLFMAEFFIGDAFHSYMKPSQMIFGAGGIAADYMDIVVKQLLSNWWRILIVLLPIPVYIRFGRFENDLPVRKKVLFYLLTAVAGVAAGMAGIAAGPDGMDVLGSKYDFNSAVQTHGICISMFQELSGRGDRNTAEELVIDVVPVEETAPAEPEEESFVAVPHEIPGLDLESIAETGGTYGNLCKYMVSQPAAKTNKYTGLFEGKNLILIMAEAFTTQVIDKDRTPALYRMANNGIRFTDYYQPLWNGSTIGGEMSILSGLVPNMGTGMAPYAAQRPFNTLGAQLTSRGYYTRAYHNNDMGFYGRSSSHGQLGWSKFIAMGNGMEKGVKNIWPQSDLEMVDFTLPELIENQPFSAYYISVSGHSMYTWKGNAQARKNYELVEDLPYSEPIKIYLAANMELEKAMASLIRQLEEAGIADDTVVVISADHYPYGLDTGSAWGNSSNYLKELKNVDSYDDFIRDSSTLIIWSGCLEGMNLQVDAPTYSLDILPTVSNLFGFEYDSRLTVGRDVLGTEEAIVLWPNFSWKTSLGRYYGSEKRFCPNEGVEIPEGYVERMNTIVRNKINFSHSVQSAKFYHYLRQRISQIEKET